MTVFAGGDRRLGAANQCGSAEVTTPSLRATPPKEGNFKTMPIFVVTEKFTSFGAP